MKKMHETVHDLAFQNLNHNCSNDPKSKNIRSHTSTKHQFHRCHTAVYQEHFHHPCNPADQTQRLDHPDSNDCIVVLYETNIWAGNDMAYIYGDECGEDGHVQAVQLVWVPRVSFLKADKPIRKVSDSTPSLRTFMLGDQRHDKGLPKIRIVI